MTVETEEPDNPPGIRELLGQLANDTTDFARAEMAWLRAEAGERSTYALPGLIMLGLALACLSGAVVAGFAGLVIWLGPMIGTGWAIVLVVAGACSAAALLYSAGIRRIKKSIKAREKR